MNREAREIASKLILNYGTHEADLRKTLMTMNAQIMDELTTSSGQVRNCFWRDNLSEFRPKKNVKSPKYNELLITLADITQSFIREDEDDENSAVLSRTERLAIIKQDLDRIERITYNPYRLIEQYAIRFGRGHVFSDNFMPNVVKAINEERPPKIQHLTHHKCVELALIAGQSLGLDCDYDRISEIVGGFDLKTERQAASLMNHRINISKDDLEDYGLMSTKNFSTAWMMEHGIITNLDQIREMEDYEIVLAAALDTTDRFRNGVDEIIEKQEHLRYQFRLLRALVTSNTGELSELSDSSDEEIAITAILAMDGRGIERSRNVDCHFARMLLGTNDINVIQNPETDIPNDSLSKYDIDDVIVTSDWITGKYTDTQAVYGYNFLHTSQAPSDLTEYEQVLTEYAIKLVNQINDKCPTFIRRPETIILEQISLPEAKNA